MLISSYVSNKYKGTNKLIKFKITKRLLDPKLVIIALQGYLDQLMAIVSTGIS